MIEGIKDPVKIWYDLWKHKFDPPRYDIAGTFRVFGMRYSAKSAFLEAVSCKFRKHNATIIDVFGSRDGESAAWAQDSCPYKNILFLTGDSVKLDFANRKFDQIKISEFTLKKAEEYEIVVTTPRFYKSENEQYRALSRIVDCLKWRDEFLQKDGSLKIDCLLVREARKLLTSRIVAGAARDIQAAERDFIDLHDEGYHVGVSFLIDTLRPGALEINIREIANYTIIKRIGKMELPRQYWHLAKYFNNDWDYIRGMPLDEFILQTDKNAVCNGHFDKVPWHIVRGESLITKLGISIVTEPGISISPVSTYTNSDARKVDLEAHLKIIKLKSEGLSYEKVAREIGRPKEEGGLGLKMTWQAARFHVTKHNATPPSCLCADFSS